MEQMDNQEIARELYRWLTGDNVMDMRSAIIYCDTVTMIQQLHRVVSTLHITEDRLNRIKASPLPGGNADELAEAV